jgi:hypothetical protein
MIYYSYCFQFDILYTSLFFLSVIMKKVQVGCNTISQGREALVGSPFLCERAPHATKPPRPEVAIHNVENIIFKSKPE